jgi:hypothetical protein
MPSLRLSCDAYPVVATIVSRAPRAIDEVAECHSEAAPIDLAPGPPVLP